MGRNNGIKNLGQNHAHPQRSWKRKHTLLVLSKLLQYIQHIYTQTTN